jgi:hypothetical protein
VYIVFFSAVEQVVQIFVWRYILQLLQKRILTSGFWLLTLIDFVSWFGVVLVFEFD